MMNIEPFLVIRTHQVLSLNYLLDSSIFSILVKSAKTTYGNHTLDFIFELFDWSFWFFCLRSHFLLLLGFGITLIASVDVHAGCLCILVVYLINCSNLGWILKCCEPNSVIGNNYMLKKKSGRKLMECKTCYRYRSALLLSACSVIWVLLSYDFRIVKAVTFSLSFSFWVCFYLFIYFFCCMSFGHF